MSDKITARDVSRPGVKLHFDGKDHICQITMRSFGIAEGVMADEFDARLNFGDILLEMSEHPTLRALMAVCYGLLKASGVAGSDGKPLKWSEFEDKFTLDIISRDDVARALQEALPKPEAGGNAASPLGVETEAKTD